MHRIRPLPSPHSRPLKKDAGVVGADTKIIKTGSVTLEVSDVTGTVESIQALVTAQGGYLSSSTIQASGSRHTGTVVIRMPQARFETTLAGVKSAGTVKSVSTQGEDVTEEYIDLQAQKKSYEVQLAQYYVLMKKATKISDILAIQQQIDRVQTELNRLEGRLKYLDSQIDLSTITITPAGTGTGPRRDRAYLCIRDQPGHRRALRYHRYDHHHRHHRAAVHPHRGHRVFPVPLEKGEPAGTGPDGIARREVTGVQVGDENFLCKIPATRAQPAVAGVREPAVSCIPAPTRSPPGPFPDV